MLADIYNAKSFDQEYVHRLACDFVQSVRKLSNPVRVFLFGSAAKKEFRHGSDIDLLLVYESIIELRQARKNLSGLSRILDGIPVDLVFMITGDFTQKSQLGGVAFDALKGGIEI